MILTLDRSRQFPPIRQYGGGLADRLGPAAIRRTWPSLCSRWGSPFLVNAGIDASLDPPADGVSIVDPVLTDWDYSAAHSGLTSIVTFHDNTTTGTPCTIQFYVKYGKNTTISTWSETEDNSPHYGCVCTVTNGLQWSHWNDLYWRWKIEGYATSEWELVALAAVFVPGIGDPVIP